MSARLEVEEFINKIKMDSSDTNDAIFGQNRNRQNPLLNDVPD